MNEAVKRAAQWLATKTDEQRPRPLIWHLQMEFGLTALEAIEAAKESHLIKGRAS